jgi:hypothetical protein
MSSISSIGGGIDLSQYYQGVAGTNSASPASTTAATTAISSTDPTSSTDAGQQVHGHHHRGGHGKGGGANSQLFSQLQTAVTSALQSATPGTDPNQTIEEAISQVFQNNNSAAQTGSETQQASTTDPNAAQANTPLSTTPSGNGTSGNSALQAFFQTLQSAGVNPQQFHQDFFTAVQNAQNGSVNPSTALQSLPIGSLVDATG